MHVRALLRPAGLSYLLEIMFLVQLYRVSGLEPCQALADLFHRKTAPRPLYCAINAAINGSNPHRSDAFDQVLSQGLAPRSPPGSKAISAPWRCLPFSPDVGLLNYFSFTPSHTVCFAGTSQQFDHECHQ